MENLFTGFAIGFLVGIASCIAVSLDRRRKGDSAGTVEERIDRNNSDIRSGINRSEAEIERARKVNTGLGNINNEAIEGINNTERTVSKLIAAAKRKKSKG